MKRPAFQFYPGDWLKDAALRSCSLEARGLWADMLSLMHQAEPYGHLVLNGLPIDDAALGRMVGATPSKVRRLIEELERSGTASRRADGALYSRRMVRDEQLRNERAEFGKLGGNPKLKGKVNPPHKPEQTPSSSSSSSSSNPLSLVAEDWQPPEWVGARLQMAGRPPKWLPENVGAFIAHYRGLSVSRRESEWGELFVKWMLRESVYAQGEKRGTTNRRNPSLAEQAAEAERIAAGWEPDAL